MKDNDPPTISPTRALLRRLKRDERVQRGDFVQDENQEFKFWVGLNGFRADSFVQQIYRWREPLPVKTKKQA